MGLLLGWLRLADGGDSRVASPTGLSSWEPIWRRSSRPALPWSLSRLRYLPRAMDDGDRRFWAIVVGIVLVALYSVWVHRLFWGKVPQQDLASDRR